MKNRKNNQITGNIGLFYVCHQLSLQGWNVLPTSRNTRGVDIIAYDETGNVPLLIQVKTLAQKSPVPLGKSVDNLMQANWIIVVNATNEKPDVFILHSSDIKDMAHRGEKDGKVSYWLQPVAYYIDKYRAKEQWKLK